MTKEISKDWKKALATQVQKAVAREQEFDGIPQISLKGGRMSLNDKMIPGDELQCIILHARYERSWYNRPYSPDDKSPPDCYALSVGMEDKMDMSPAENVPKPGNDQCKGCPQAEFGTALRGKGPACKTRVRLAVMAAPDNLVASDFDDPKIALYLTQPTSTVNYDGVGREVGYDRELANQGLAHWAVKTKIVLLPHDKKLHETTFHLVGRLDDELMPSALHATNHGYEATAQPFRYEKPETEQEKEASSKM